MKTKTQKKKHEHTQTHDKKGIQPNNNGLKHKYTFFEIKLSD